MRPGLTEGVAVKAYIFKDNKLLVIYKTEAEAQGNLNTEDRRDIPGGRVEFGEQPEIALRREVYEEVGLQIDVLQPFMVWSFVKNELQLVGINYLCLWHSGEVVLSVEHEKYEWLTYEDILRRNWGEEQYHKAFEHFVEYKRNTRKHFCVSAGMKKACRIRSLTRRENCSHNTWTVFGNFRIWQNACCSRTASVWAPE